jgi:hypothetical protein
LSSGYISSRVANFHPKTTSGLLSIFKGHMVNSSSNVMLLDSARVGFLRQFNDNGH